MTSVYSGPRAISRERGLLRAVARASTLHVGAAAAAAALRDELIASGLLDEADFNEAFAVARLTPGTTLLALVVLVGYRVAGLRGALLALAAGTALPGSVVILAAAGYVAYADSPAAAAAMAGAQAVAIAVFAWAAARLAWPVVRRGFRSRGAFAGVAALIVAADLMPPFTVIVLAAAAGAILLRDS